MPRTRRSVAKLPERDRTGSELDDILTCGSLLELAGAKSYSRGWTYFEDGLVRSLSRSLNMVSSTVRGTSTYRVKLWVENGELNASCTCPWAAEGNFCKHCVAVGLAWLEQDSEADTGEPTGKRPDKPRITPDDIRTMLKSESKDHLVEMIMEQAAADHALAERLVLKAARHGQQDPDIATYRKVITDAFRTGGHVPWQEVYEYARRIDQAVTGIEELLSEGHAAQAMELAELGLRQYEHVIGMTDDSNGEISGIRDRLQELHLSACRKARPEPEALARKLFDWEMKSEWDVFAGAARPYARVLGRKGLAVYRELAEAVWAKVPALKPGDKRDSYEHKRFAITSIMETLAELSGSIEEQVAVRSRDLSHAYSFLQIAETCRRAGQSDKALDWAEKGLKAFPQRTDSRLRVFLADEYHRRKRHDEAVALIWNEFTDDPRLDNYRLLKQHASRAGQWPSWREDALSSIRERVRDAEDRQRGHKFALWNRTDHSELVRIFLWEKNPEAAWEEAQAGGCSDELWLELAARREKEHPEDAIAVYRRQVEPVIAGKNNAAYREAVRLMVKVHKLMASLDRTAEFQAFVADLRMRHKPKRNLMKLLDRANWS